MEKWEIALSKFMKKWENKKEVVGAVICGSYVTGNPSKHSDLDLHIILDKNTTWRERGNEIIDGFLIEYFANPSKYHDKYFEENYNRRRRHNAHMFITGRILFDKTGEVKKLVKKAKQYYNKKYPKLNNTIIEIQKYSLWDMCDNLEESYGADEFVFVYHNNLYSLFEAYSKFLRYDSIDVHKLRRFLIDEKDKKKYNISDFPDKVFVDRFVKAMILHDRSKMIKEYKQLTKHVLDKMGGLEVDGWKIRS